MGSLRCEIRRTGRIVLVDGALECRQDKDGQNELIGKILVGIDGLYFDGMEPIFCQRDDPAKLRLASRYVSQHGEHTDGMNGVISYNRLRDDDRMEERVQLQGGAIEDWRQHPGTERGQFRIAVRASDIQHGEETAFVATTAFLGRLWTGASNSMGWLWKMANPGEQPPAGGSPASAEHDGTVAMSANGRFWVVQQSDGSLCKYELMTPFDKGTGVLRWAAKDQ